MTAQANSSGDAARIVLRGNTAPAIRGRMPVGAADPSLPMERMILAFRMEPEARARLDQLLASQQNPGSKLYHAWLTPETFATAYAPGPQAVAKVSGWLEAQGFSVEGTARGGMSLVFSGTVDTVQRAFHTPMQRFSLAGSEHLANGLDPSIPQELAGMVHGVVSLHDFRRKPAHAGLKSLARPLYDTGGSHYLSPPDFASIYDLAPLLAQGSDGSGVSIAIVARANPGLADTASFRTEFGLPAGHAALVLNGPDPGTVSSDEAAEANLDLQWSGATAPGASIQLVCSRSTATSDGVDLSASYAVNNNLASIMSVSFGSCESDMGATELAFYDNLWAQAAAQGITVCVAAGDAGAAGCDNGGAASASGRAVSGMASTPGNVCVGGTMFLDAGGAYWAGTNAVNGLSALGYIPEAAWNESGSQPMGSGLWAGGGGVSAIYDKPYWQTGPGVPGDARRDVPDVAFAAASHDGYLFYTGGSLSVVAGTSAAAPAFAGIMALMVQKSGQRQGLPNPQLYAAAATQAQGGGPAIFHDIATGNNSVPGTAGFNAGPGYDQATGLGSLDAALFVNAQTGMALSPAQVFTLLKLGAPYAQTFTPSGGTAPYALSVAQGGLPPGLALTAGGALTGTLTSEGTFSFALKASDSTGQSAGAAGLVQVGPVAVALAPQGSGLMVGYAATITAKVTGAVDTSVTWSASGGTVTPTGPTTATFSATTAGSYSLTAASTANPNRSASMELLVHDGGFQDGNAGQPLTGLDALYLAGETGTRTASADLNGDGIVDDSDIALLLTAMGW